MKNCPLCEATYSDDMRFCGQDGRELVDSPATDPLVGHVVGDTYRLRRVLGVGGFGAVYEAGHERLPMTVAVKLLDPSRAIDPTMVSRFRLEVEAEALLTHPNIVRVLDHGQDKLAGFYIVMELLRGRDLGKLMEAKQKLGILEIFAVIDQAASALAAAHKVGIVHRDVKAENLFLVDDPSRSEGFLVKLLDFGIARLTRDIPTANGAIIRAMAHRSVATRTFGSPATMSPEVATAGKVDHRTDIYSLGAAIFELLTGHILFEAKTIEDMLYKIVHQAPTPPSSIGGGAWVPPDLDALVVAMLAKDPDKRPQSMDEVRRQFEKTRPAAESAWAQWFLPGGKAMGGRSLERPPASSTGARHGATCHRERPLVVAVDDDRVMRTLVQSLIESSGCDCESFESGDSALAWMLRNPAPDAVVCDLLMPGLDGLTLIDAARAHGYPGPVVFCSSVVSAKLRRDTAEIGKSWCLDKARELHRLPETLRLAGVMGGRIF